MLLLLGNSCMQFLSGEGTVLLPGVGSTSRREKSFVLVVSKVLRLMDFSVF